MQHPHDPPYQETQISWYPAVQIKIEMLASYEFVLGNLRFLIWWILGV